MKAIESQVGIILYYIIFLKYNKNMYETFHACSDAVGELEKKITAFKPNPF